VSDGLKTLGLLRGEFLEAGFGRGVIRRDFDGEGRALIDDSGIDGVGKFSGDEGRLSVGEGGSGGNARRAL
jgi:hypothetical protein